MDLVDGMLEGWLSLVKENITRIDYTLVVLSPWDRSKPLTRAWCLYEIFCGLQAESKNVQYVMSPHEWTALKDLAQRDCTLASAAMSVNVVSKSPPTRIYVVAFYVVETFVIFK
jgi:hypothetical protein